jgi:hypothetical protein
VQQLLQVLQVLQVLQALSHHSGTGNSSSRR